MLEEERKQAHTAVFAWDLGQHCRAYIYDLWVCRKLIECDWLESKTWLESVMIRKCFSFVCSEQKPWMGQQREGERLSGAGGQQRHPITTFTSVHWNVCATRATPEPRVLRVSPFKKYYYLSWTLTLTPFWLTITKWDHYHCNDRVHWNQELLSWSLILGKQFITLQSLLRVMHPHCSRIHGSFQSSSMEKDAFRNIFQYWSGTVLKISRGYW